MLALTIISRFETVNPIRKYRTDWKNFLAESRLEDFAGDGGDTIYISTIHKSKGKEFDNVYLVLNYFRPDTDEKKRLLYVAMTRARSVLRIHCNESFFRGIIDDTVNYEYDNNIYGEPAVLTICLSHKQVNLGYFEYVQGRMEGLQSGSPLLVIEEGLGNAQSKLVLKYSAEFNKELKQYKDKGYELKEAIVNFVLWWLSESHQREVKIVLPEIVLRKGQPSTDIP